MQFYATAQLSITCAITAAIAISLYLSAFTLIGLSVISLIGLPQCVFRTDTLPFKKKRFLWALHTQSIWRTFLSGTLSYYSSPCHWTHLQQFTTRFLKKKKKKNYIQMKNSGAVAEFRPLPVPFLIDYTPQKSPKAPGHLARVKGMSTNKHKINAVWWSTVTSITTGSLSNKWVITQGQTTGCCSCQRCWEVTTSSSSTVPHFFFFIKILQSKFSFYRNKLRQIIQFNSGVGRTMKFWRIEQRKHQNNSYSRSKVFVHAGHPKCIINTALSLATSSSSPR